MSTDHPPIPPFIESMAADYEQRGLDLARQGAAAMLALTEDTPMPKDAYARSLAGEIAAGLVAEYVRMIAASIPDMPMASVWIHCITDVQMRAQGRLIGAGETKQ